VACHLLAEVEKARLAPAERVAEIIVCILTVLSRVLIDDEGDGEV